MLIGPLPLPPPPPPPEEDDDDELVDFPSNVPFIAANETNKKLVNHPTPISTTQTQTFDSGYQPNLEKLLFIFLTKGVKL